MVDPDWMENFKSPTAVPLSSSSPSSSPSRDVKPKRTDSFYDTGQYVSETNGKDDSDDEEDSFLITAVTPGRGSKAKARGRGRGLGRGRGSSSLRGRGSISASQSQSQEMEDSPAKPARKVSPKEAEKVETDDVQGEDDDDDEEQPRVFVSRRAKGLKRAMESEEEEEEDVEEQKSRKNSRKRGPKRALESAEEEEDDLGQKNSRKKGSKGALESAEEEEDDLGQKSSRKKGSKRALESAEEEEDDLGQKNSRKKGSKRAMESEEEEEEEDEEEDEEEEEEEDVEEEYKPPAKVRKTTASPQVRKSPQVKKSGAGKAPNSGRKGKRVSFSEEEDMPTLKRVKKELPLVGEEDDDEESAPLSSLVKKDKKATTAAGAVVVLEDGLGTQTSTTTTTITTSIAVKKEPLGATALKSLMGEGDSTGDGGNAPLMKEESVHGEETAEASERKSKPRASSTLPVIFAEKVHRTKVLLECEGDALDLSGDMGAVGRFSVGEGQEKGKEELLLDLKGIIYKATIVPSNTFFVVNVGHAEAKVEAIMNDFMQLRPDVNQAEDETIVEGTLEGFAFDLDNEGEPLSTPVPASGLVDSDGDEDMQPKKKTPIKTQKSKKVTASKGGKGSRSKGGGKGATAKKPRAKAKASTKKPSKAKQSGAKSVKSKKP